MYQLCKHLLSTSSRRMVHSSQSLRALLFGAKCQFSRDYPSLKSPGESQQIRLSAATYVDLALNSSCIMPKMAWRNFVCSRNSNGSEHSSQSLAKRVWINASVTFMSQALVRRIACYNVVLCSYTASLYVYTNIEVFCTFIYEPADLHWLMIRLIF